MHLTVNFGKNLKEKRLTRGLKQEDLAYKVNVTRETINRLENSKTSQISNKLLIDICNELKITPSELINTSEAKIEVVKNLQYKNTEKIIDVGIDFPQRLKESRKKKKITQEELAQKIGAARITVIRLEQGKNIPSKRVFYNLIKVLDVDAFWFYGDVSEKRLNDYLIESTKNDTIEEN